MPIQYRGGVDFEDEGRVRVIKKPASGFLFTVIKKLHLAKTDSGATVWAFCIFFLIVIFLVRLWMNFEWTVELDKTRPTMTAEQLIEYNKLQPFDYESAIKALQQ